MTFFRYEGSDPIPQSNETMEQYHARIIEARKAPLPALAEVQRRVVERAAWLRYEPLAVEPDLWATASEQHRQILEERGWPLAVDKDMARQGKQHFLLLGVPIVMDEA